MFSTTNFRQIVSVVVLMHLTFSVFAQQQIIITGTVYEKDSITTIPFAYVVVKSKSSGVLADINGHYSIRASITDTLIYSYTGMSTVKISLLKRIDQVVNNKIVIKIGRASCRERVCQYV